MPNVNPNSPVIAPGVTTTPDKYPQWGVKQIGSGGTGTQDYSVKEATTAAQKTADLAAGYAVWFNSATAAGDFVSSQNSILNGNLPNPVPGLAQIGDFFGALSQKNTWMRVAKVLIGGVLVIVGISHMTGAGNAVASTARKVPVII